MKIILKKNDEIIKFECGYEFSFNEIQELYIITKQIKTIQNKFIVKIIPLKDEKGFYKFNNNKDYKLIFLI